jgi:hypothetical protein
MDAAAETDAPRRWQDDLYELLRANGVTQFAYVPDAGHRILIDRSLADPDAHSVALTTEDAAEIQAQPRRVGMPRPFPRGAAVLTGRIEPKHRPAPGTAVVRRLPASS